MRLIHKAGPDHREALWYTGLGDQGIYMCVVSMVEAIRIGLSFDVVGVTQLAFLESRWRL